MSQARLTLDNQAFHGTLRYTRRSVAYSPRPVQTSTIQDVLVVRQQRKPELPAKAALPPVKTQSNRLVFMGVKPPAQQKHVRSQVKPHVVQQAATVQPRPAVQKRRKHLRIRHLWRRQTLLYAGAALVFGLGLYVGLSGLNTNKQVAVQVKALQKQAVQSATTVAPPTVAPTPPSTEKPTPAAVRSYTVSPVNPRYIDIPKLKVHGRVLSMGVDRKNELQSPYGIYDAGWYNASSKPGENGAMLIDGHSGIGKTRGIFHDIVKLAAGDDISVKRGDGQVFTYKVVDVQVRDADKVDMASLLVSADTAKPGLSLITCAGDQIPGTFSLKQRVVVRAVMQ